MSTAYPQLESYFGLLTGAAYTVPYALGGLFFGRLGAKISPKLLVAGLMSLQAGLMGLTASINSFPVMASSRLASGFVSSGFNPLCFAIMANYFPADRRTTANSLFASSKYVGGGLASMSLLSIMKYGWRSTYAILAAFAIMISLSVLFFIKDSEKVDVKSKKKKDEDSGNNLYLEMLKHPVNRYVLLGSFMSAFSGAIITYYLPVFFLRTYPLFKS